MDKSYKMDKSRVSKDLEDNRSRMTSNSINLIESGHESDNRHNSEYINTNSNRSSEIEYNAPHMTNEIP